MSKPKSKKASRRTGKKQTRTPVRQELIDKMHAMVEGMTKRLATEGIRIPGPDEPEIGR